MKHLDLFSGIGGFALAARWMGWETVQFVEIDEFCQKVLLLGISQILLYFTFAIHALLFKIASFC